MALYRSMCVMFVATLFSAGAAHATSKQQLEGRWRSSPSNAAIGEAFVFDLAPCAKSLCGVLVENEQCGRGVVEPLPAPGKEDFYVLKVGPQKNYVGQMTSYDASGQKSGTKILLFFGVSKNEWDEPLESKWTKMISRRSYPIEASFEYIGPAACAAPVS